MIANKLIAIAGLAAIAVVAQDPTSSAPTSLPTDAIPPCVLQCLGSVAGTGGCSTFADVSCVCNSQEFQQAALQCLQSQCTQEEQQAALALQQSQCAAVSGSASGSGAAPTASGSGSGSGSGALPSATGPRSSGSPSGSGSGSNAPAATNSNAASAKVAFTSSGFMALGLAMAGAVVGGAMVL